MHLGKTVFHAPDGFHSKSRIPPRGGGVASGTTLSSSLDLHTGRFSNNGFKAIPVSLP